MQVNMLETENQLSKLVKAAVEGNEVIIASNGEPLVRLVPCGTPHGLSQWGAWADKSVDLDAAFSDEADARVGQLLGLL